MRLVARTVTTEVDHDEQVVPPELLNLPRLGPPRPIGAPAVQQHERPALTRDVIADPDAVIPDLQACVTSKQEPTGDISRSRVQRFALT